MNIETELENLGFAKNESKTYLGLLEIGPATTTPLIKKTGINTSKVYESLERLLKKGLVSYSKINNKKHWQVEDPSAIRKYLDEKKDEIVSKEESLIKLMPLLNSKKNLNKCQPNIRIFEGILGVKAARENVLNILKKGDTFYVMLSNYPDDHKLEAFWEDFQKRRADKGIKCKYILNKDLREVGESRKKEIPDSKVKYISPKNLSPTWIEIYGDYVSIGVMSETYSVIVIKNKYIARGFLNNFDFLWENSKY